MNTALDVALFHGAPAADCGGQHSTGADCERDDRRAELPRADHGAASTTTPLSRLFIVGAHKHIACAILMAYITDMGQRFAAHTGAEK